jgi:hypothetical protein
MGLWQETWCRKSSVGDTCHTYSTGGKKKYHTVSTVKQKSNMKTAETKAKFIPQTNKYMTTLSTELTQALK